MMKKTFKANSKLLRQGGFGCIFFPSIECSGKVNTKKNFATKVQATSFNTINEINIGKMILKIPNYSFYFVPILKSCPVKLKTIETSERELAKCKSINAHFQREEANEKENENEKSFILMTMNYITNKPFERIFSIATPSKKQTMVQLIDTFNVLLDAIGLLLKNNIVHLDLKGENILYNTKLHSVQIIDFGLSIFIPKLTRQNLNNYFYVYSPDYYVWPFEVHVINFLIHIMAGGNETILTREEIVKIVEDIVKKNNLLKIFNASFISMYVDVGVAFLTNFVGQTKSTVISELVKGYTTWDNYSLSVLYLGLLTDIFPDGLPDHSFINKFYKMLIHNILPDFSKRYTIEETKSVFKDIFFSEDTIQEYINLIR